MHDDGGPAPVDARNRLWSLSSDLMCVTDEEGVLLAVNNAWTARLGWEEAELVGRDVCEFVHRDDLGATKGEFASLARGLATERFENRLRGRDGQFRRISWRASPAEGLIYAVGRDITERLRREEALRQSQKMEAIGQLTGGIAHDFNNLLTIIRSSLDFVSRPDLPEARRARYLNAMSDAVGRAVRVTSQLLAFARRQRLEPEVFEVGERIADVSELLRQLVGPRIEICTVAPDEPCCVEADLCQFETALMNFAINARDAMEGEGRLTIEVGVVSDLPEGRSEPTSDDGFVAVSVRDTGPGIASEHVGRVFEPFFTTKAVGKGTGLGLAQVYGFVKQSGGDVDVRNAEGGGAVFTMYLPRTRRAQARPRPAAQPSAVDRTRRRILLVEDNEEVGAFCSDLLADLGYASAWARSGNEALEMLGQDGGGYDLVFSDVVMPGMSGLELAERLQGRRPHIPVLLTSGYSPLLTEGDVRFPLLRKPYSPVELSRALEALLRRRTVQPGAARTPSLDQASGGRGGQGAPTDRRM